MKTYLTLIALVCSTTVFAHDEGHGPKLTDAGKQGGVVSPVIDSKQVKSGAKAEVIYKAELVRSEDGTTRVYFYDKDMKPLPLSKFDKTAKGYVEFKKKDGKWSKQEFALTQEDGEFIGKAPKAESKRFNIDVLAKEGGRELLTAFDNLD